MAQARRLIRLSTVATAVLASVGMATMHSASADPSPSGVDPMIIGGEETTTDENPFVVALTDTSGFQFCGGTLVAPNKVVTAAHCTEGDSPGDIKVVAGRTTLSTDEGTVADVTDIWLHPDWNRAELSNDASVLTLASDLEYAPMELASPDDTDVYEPGVDSTVLGWGVTEDGGASDTLRQVTVPVTSDEDCSGSYGDDYIAETMVCAGLPEGGKDACQGDSGGPLYAVGADGTQKLIGIVSWGQGCAEPDFYGVYGRVSAFYDLLQEQIGG